jgi:hypothetical protein
VSCTLAVPWQVGCQLADADADVSAGNLIVSAGEDCRLFLTRCSPEGEFSGPVPVPAHLGTIRALALSHDQTGAPLIFSGGARVELRCWWLQLPDRCRAQRGRGHSAAANLSTATGGSWGSACVGGDCGARLVQLGELPKLVVSTLLDDCRVMDMAVRPLGAGRHLMVIGFSDAHWRLALFDEESRRFHFLLESAFHNRCLLHTDFCDFDSEHLLAVTSGTDGRIAFWDVSAYVEAAASLDMYQPMSGVVGRHSTHLAPLLVVTAHPSGVNDVAVIKSDAGQLICLSGGDDNAIAVAVIAASVGSTGKLSLTQASAFTHPSAHASSVTGVCAVTPTTVVSVAADGRLNVWALEQRATILRLQESHVLSVADPQGVSPAVSRPGMSASKTQVVVCGLGMEVFTATAL